MPVNIVDRFDDSTSEDALHPDPKNKLSWSTSGSVEKNLPYLTKAHAPLLSKSSTKAVLEIASGFLDHCLSYAREHPTVQFWPTEYDEYLVHKLQKRIDEAGKENIQKAKKLDVLSESDWSSLLRAAPTPFDVISVTNLLNVAPWQVTEQLFRQMGKQDILNREHGILAIYCCLKIGGQFQSEADEKFDAQLRSRTPEFGIRNLDDIVKLAEAQGMTLVSQEALAGGTNLFLQFKFA